MPDTRCVIPSEKRCQPMELHGFVNGPSCSDRKQPGNWNREVCCALQRAAYFSVPVAGLLSVATGWAIHKPMQLHWLAALFGGYDAARVWHFWLMWVCILFVVPHVILVFADGWDTLRSMIVGWSMRVKRSEVVANEQ